MINPVRLTKYHTITIVIFVTITISILIYYCNILNYLPALLLTSLIIRILIFMKGIWMHCESNKIVPGYMVELASSFNATEVWIYCSYLHYYFFGKIARITTKGRSYSNMISISHYVYIYYCIQNYSEVLN